MEEEINAAVQWWVKKIHDHNEVERNDTFSIRKQIVPDDAIERFEAALTFVLNNIITTEGRLPNWGIGMADYQPDKHLQAALDAAEIKVIMSPFATRARTWIEQGRVSARDGEYGAAYTIYGGD